MFASEELRGTIGGGKKNIFETKHALGFDYTTCCNKFLNLWNSLGKETHKKLIRAHPKYLREARVGHLTNTQSKPI